MIQQKIGKFSEEVITVLNISITPGTPIYISASNLTHMAKSHPADYLKYGKDIPDIISMPDYVGINPSDGSIEYVREYQKGTEFVKVAVRISMGGNYYVRSIYRLEDNRTKNYIAKGTLKKI